MKFPRGDNMMKRKLLLASLATAIGLGGAPDNPYRR
jgi:hypothetical protein